MNLVVRIAVGAGLFIFGYWLGREVGRAESGRPAQHDPAEPQAMQT